MTSYFEAFNAKSALKTNQIFNSDGSRTDLLLDQYKLSRDRLLTINKVAEINDMYMKWCDLLFSGFNVVVLGAQSKYSLLETFKKKYLDIGPIPDFRAATGFNCDHTAESSKPKERSSRRKTNAAKINSTIERRTTRSRKTPDSVATPTSTESTPPPPNVDPELCPMINVVTVRMHGLDPIKQETFNHAVFQIKESRRPRESDYIDFIKQITAENQHYVFLIHSFEYFLKECEEVCETIFRLCSMDPIRTHLLMSSDLLNAGKKLNNLKIQLRLTFFTAPFSESFFWEKSQLVGEFDAGENAHNETAVHRLFNDKTDLQSLKDIYQALDGATAGILEYIFKDYVEKCEAEQAEDDNDDDDFVPLALVADNSGDEGGNKNRMQPKRKAKERARQAKRSQKEKLGTHLDFHHLLKYCESQFIVRRGVALRNHLGELKDHRIVSEDGAGNKIQCLVKAPMCRKFLEWVATQRT